MGSRVVGCAPLQQTLNMSKMYIFMCVFPNLKYKIFSKYTFEIRTYNFTLISPPVKGCYFSVFIVYIIPEFVQ